MSTWAGIELGGYTIDEWQNTYHKWLFRDSERFREVKQDSQFIGYRMEAEKLKRRLELQGVNRQSVELDFNELKALWVKDLKSILQSLGDSDNESLSDFLLYLDGLQKCSIDSWLKLIPIAHHTCQLTNESETCLITDQHKIHQSLTETERNLLKFMCSNYDEYPNYTAGGYHFPCQSIDSYAWAILQFIEPNSVCELNLSDLISSGWVDDFEDLAEYQEGQTKFYARAKAEIREIISLSESGGANPVLQRLAYSGLITILEAYLSDVAKRQVLNKEAIRRRFVERYEPFGNGQKTLRINELFSKMEQLDKLITDYIDSQSFHSVKTINTFYSSVLLVNLSSHLLKRLSDAVDTRHDIIHRAGKTKDGEPIEITLKATLDLSELVFEVMASVDEQIVDGLLDDQ
ncbi:HEPN/Toprim-associated domain-containing protein [Marinomonas sp. TI.3.20]|uniref:HEPN/Toprim-associated domain-containing protein n=1 Tax=Marinomonas sp. TI.3.20 TaxID=3121296 RepID=UPI00311FABDE